MPRPATLPAVTGADLPPLGFAHAQPLDVTKIEPVRNQHFTKPRGGLWLSRCTGGSTIWREWTRVCWGSRVTDVVTRVWLRATARVLCIDSLDDLAAVVAAYPPPPVPEGMLDNVSAFDFEAAAGDYDAVWVTGRGVAQTATTEFPNLMLWDIETVLVLTVHALAPRP